jgi:hypothetical protein
VKNDRRWKMKYKNKSSMGYTEVYVPKPELKVFYSIVSTYLCSEVDIEATGHYKWRWGMWSKEYTKISKNTCQ